ncbi:MAG: cutinase family protein [Thermoleophilia bacterium]
MARTWSVLGLALMWLAMSVGLAAGADAAPANAGFKLIGDDTRDMAALCPNGDGPSNLVLVITVRGSGNAPRKGPLAENYYPQLASELVRRGYRVSGFDVVYGALPTSVLTDGRIGEYVESAAGQAPRIATQIRNAINRCSTRRILVAAYSQGGIAFRAAIANLREEKSVWQRIDHIDLIADASAKGNIDRGMPTGRTPRVKGIPRVASDGVWGYAADLSGNIRSPVAAALAAALKMKAVHWAAVRKMPAIGKAVSYPTALRGRIDRYCASEDLVCDTATVVARFRKLATKSSIRSQLNLSLSLHTAYPWKLIARDTADVYPPRSGQPTTVPPGGGVGVPGAPAGGTPTPPSPGGDPEDALPQIGTYMAAPPEGRRELWPARDGRFIVIVNAAQGATGVYVGWTIPGATASAEAAAGVLLPGRSATVTTDEDGVAYVAVNDDEDTGVGGRLVKLRPDASAGRLLLELRADAQGYVRVLDEPVVVGDEVYVEAYATCRTRMYAIHTVTGQAREGRGASGCGGNWASSGNTAAVLGLSGYSVQYYDAPAIDAPTEIRQPPPASAPGYFHTGFGAGAAVALSTEGCAAGRITQMRRGETWSRLLGEVLDGSCDIMAVTAVGDGTVALVVRRNGGELWAAIIGPTGPAQVIATVPRTDSIGQAWVDGQGRLVIAYTEIVDCVTSTPFETDCARLHVDVFEGTTLVGSYSEGGTSGNSMRIISDIVGTDGAVALSLQRGEYSPCVGCGAPGAVPVERRIPLPVQSASW